jgi:hypothetical protein
VTGNIRKISVYVDVPLSGESTLIFANTLWRGAKDSVCFLRNLLSQCWNTVCDGVFDVYLACGGNSVQCCDCKDLGAKCGGHGKNCTEVSRHRRRCDLPWATGATGGGTDECCSVSSVVGLRDFVLGVLATAGHGVETGAGDDEGTAVAGSLSQTLTRSGEVYTTHVRGPRGTREKRCRLQARMLVRRVPGRTTAGLDSCVLQEGGPCCLRQYPIEQVVRGRDAHVGVQHTGATTHSCCGLEGGEDSILSIQSNQNAGGVSLKTEASRGA